MAIQMRRGQAVDFNPSKMLPGEWAVSQDNEKLYMCFTPGRVVEIGSSGTIIPYVQQAEAWAVGEIDGEPVSIDDPQYNNNSKYYANEARDAVDDIYQYIDDSEAWAKGTRGGVPVTSEDETYHNNSKYYAEASEGHADNASDYAADAAASKADAETSAEDAEAWSVGTRNGEPIPRTDPAYNKYAKHWADTASAITGIGIATTSSVGIVKPDGTSISVDVDGTIHSSNSASIVIEGKKVVVL